MSSTLYIVKYSTEVIDSSPHHVVVLISPIPQNVVWHGILTLIYIVENKTPQTKGETMNENVQRLQTLMESGDFHHATYRCRGTVWEGLWFYRRDPNGFRRYSVAGCVNLQCDGQAAVDAAHDLVRHTGISVGSYGQG